ncbi:NACHT domain-containing protein [Plantactinospora sp. S1510]|uniref:NACHT domain-containing protein n=1 Tax=Plantactinospora alkalitolerans TaxID=2789879 RepID=A0ABS0H336_9ACTN|nr:NACHT domain-containing protein [Plantactinospora alkalitolerans]MBF9132865.1 NACHT domain-containing protein [Plantactinospora alkalitolerans]
MAVFGGLRRWAGFAAVVSGGLFLGSVGWVVWTVWRLPPDLQDVSDKASSVGGLLLSAGSLLLTLAMFVASLRTASSEPEQQLTRAANELARQEHRQWLADAEARGLDLTLPIDVSWEEVRLKGTTGRSQPLLRGTVNSLSATWHRLDVRQLVILGAEGSGKTSLAVSLVNDMYRRQIEPELSCPAKTPVLVSCSDWIVGQDFERWLATRLEERYPRIATDKRLFGKHPICELVRQYRILPVLDGLDELADDNRIDLLKVVSKRMGREPFIVTCRRKEFLRATKRGEVLPLATTIALKAVEHHQAINFLSAGDRVGRWDPVAEAILARPNGPLGRTLSTPLMAFLAREAYDAPQQEPIELVGFDNAVALEKHLLDAYLPAIYRKRPPSLGARRHPTYRLAQAKTSLGVLAQQVAPDGRYSIAWWRLIHILPPSVAYYGPSLLAAVLFFLAAWPTPLPLLYAVAIAIAIAASGRARPLNRIPLKLRINSSLIIKLLFLTCMPYAVFAFGDTEIPVGLPVLFFLVAGALGNGIAYFRNVSDLRDSRSSLRDDAYALTARVAIGGVLGATYAFAVLDRTVVNIVCLVVCGGVSTGLTDIFGGAWERSIVARVILAARRLIPIRAVTFLDDAHRRGVLRRIGAEYEFRHARIREHCAASGPAVPTKAPVEESVNPGLIGGLGAAVVAFIAVGGTLASRLACAAAGFLLIWLCFRKRAR